jgi:tetratricopeptide (TPR) repeat protein
LEPWIKIAIGFILLLLSLGYLYRPGFILKLNAWGRTLLFNDTHVLHYRRRWGLPLFAAATLFLFVGFRNLAYERPRPAGDLWMAYRSFLAREYRQSVSLCEGILVQDPDNAQAWGLMGSAWSALGETEKANKALNRSLALMQTDPEGRPATPKKKH